MKKFLLSALAILLAMGLMGGAFAYFQDTETSEGNTFTAGTWDLEISGSSLPIEVEYMAPGVTDNPDQTEKHWVKNIGTLKGKVWFTTKDLAEPDPTGLYAEPSEPEPSVNMTAEEFARVLYLRIAADVDDDDTFETELCDDPVYALESTSFLIDPGQTINCQFTLYLPEDLDDLSTPGNEDDNLYQADGVSFTIVWNGDTDIEIP